MLIFRLKMMFPVFSKLMSCGIAITQVLHFWQVSDKLQQEQL